MSFISRGNFIASTVLTLTGLLTAGSLLVSGLSRFTGDLKPTATNTYDVGTSTTTWRYGYFGTQVSSTQFTANPGSAAAPSFSFSNDSDTGIYTSAANTVAIGTGGSWRLSIGSSSISATSTILPGATNLFDLGSPTYSWKDVYASGTVMATSTLVGNGQASQPSFSFKGDSDTGFIRGSAADTLGFIMNGAQYFLMAATSFATPAGTFAAASWVPNSTNFADIGSPTLSFKNVYASGTVMTAGNALVATTTSATGGLTASSTLPYLGSYVYVSSTSGETTMVLSATSSIATSTIDGYVKIIVGTSDTNTLTIYDNSNVQLAGGVEFVLGIGDVLKLMWSELLGDWLEVSRSNN